MEVIKEKMNSMHWIDVAKGIGIILVVAGHFSPTLSPGYWITIKQVIYLFHMPLFFVISGYLYSNKTEHFGLTIRKKIRRLLLPFVSIALIFLLIKISAGMVFDLQHPVTVQAVLVLMIDPLSSYVPLLWFVHALFFIFIVYTALKNVVKSDSVLLILLIVVNLVVDSEDIYMGQVMRYLPYFVSGVLLNKSQKISETETIRITTSVIYVLVFVVLALVTFYQNNYLIYYLTACSGSLMILSISIAISNFGNHAVFKLLKITGYYSMGIYLFHTLFESALRIMFVSIGYTDGAKFVVAAFVSIISGIVMPILFEKYFLRRNQISRKYVLGIK